MVERPQAALPVSACLSPLGCKGTRKAGKLKSMVPLMAVKLESK